jgi:hypothetical protein
MAERSRFMSRVWLVIIILAGVGSVTFAHMMAIPALVYMVLSGAAPKGETRDDSYLRVRVAEADDATARASVTKCVDAINDRFSKGNMNSSNPICELITHNGRKVSLDTFSSLHGTNSLTNSSMSEFLHINSIDFNEREHELPKQEKFVLSTLISGSVFQIYTDYISNGEIIERNEKSIGGGGQYIVNGGLDVYYIRCNRSPYDNCVLYVDLTYPPDRSYELGVPPRLRREIFDDACTVILRFGFIEPSEPGDLEGVIDVVEMTVAHPIFNTLVRPEATKYCKDETN